MYLLVLFLSNSLCFYIIDKNFPPVKMKKQGEYNNLKQKQFFLVQKFLTTYFSKESQCWRERSLSHVI